MEECPHCHATVLMMSDQRCPACQKSAKDPKGATPHLTRIVVGAGWELPRLCLTCGVSSERRERLDSERTLGGEGTAVKFLYFLTSLVNPLNLLKLALLQGERQVVGLTFSRCERCAQDGPVRPVRADFERGAIVLLVHRRLAEAMKPAPPSRRA